MNVTEPGTETTVRYLLQKRYPSGDLKFLESAPTLEGIKCLRDWWLSDAASPEEFAKRLRVVKETTVVTYEEVEV